MEKTTQRGGLCSVLLSILLGDQLKKNEMGGACGTHGGQEKCIQGYCGRADGKRPGGRWDDNTKMDLWDAEARTGLIWLRLGTSGGFM